MGSLLWRRARAVAGFTLVELLVVLAILGLAIAIVTSRGPMRSARLQTRAGAAQFADTLRRAGLQSVLSGHPVSVVIDPTAGVFAADNSAIRSFTPGLAATTQPGTLALPRGKAVFTFNPDGSASGGGVDFTAPGSHISVTVEWLTGHVVLSHG